MLVQMLKACHFSEVLLSAGHNVMLLGEHGTGKTASVKVCVHVCACVCCVCACACVCLCIIVNTHVLSARQTHNMPFTPHHTHITTSL